MKGRHLRAGLTASLFLVSPLLVAPTPARACSMCRCGDPTFNALGTDIYSAGAFRIAVDWDRMAKTQGPPNDSEAQVADTVTATVSYSLGERLNLVARVPYSFKTLTDTTDGFSELTKTHGLSDPEFFVWYRLWASPLTAGLGRRAWVSVQAGVKTPWGQDDLEGAGGARLDQHAQPGTGSTDAFAGLGGLYMLDPASTVFGSLQYRWTGTNPYGYQYGRIFLANIGYERKLGSRLDAILELNYRWAGKDTLDDAGRKDPDTGGSVLYLTPRVLADLWGGLVARAAVLIPVFKDLNGFQTEKAIVSAGLTFSF